MLFSILLFSFFLKRNKTLVLVTFLSIRFELFYEINNCFFKKNFFLLAKFFTQKKILSPSVCSLSLFVSIHQQFTQFQKKKKKNHYLN